MASLPQKNNILFLKKLAAVALAVLLFFALAYSPLPLSFGRSVREGFLMPVVFAALFAFSLRGEGPAGLFLSLSSLLVLFSLPLSAIWNSGLSNEFLLGGLLPFSDAAGYYLDANRLLAGGVFSEFSTRRPLFACLLSTLLKFTGGNLKVTLTLLVFLTAIAVYVGSYQVRKTVGNAGAAIFMLVCFLFYRRFIGTTMTEHLGLTLGMIGFSFLWMSTFGKKPLPAYYGLAMLTLALNARAGAFFVIPFLIVWMTVHFSREGRPPYRIFFTASVTVLLAFFVNFILASVAGNPDGRQFSNFAYSLYGLVFGGHWNLAINNPPPEAIGLTGKALTDKLYQLSFKAVVHNPALLIRGMFRAWKEYFLKGYSFSFVITDPGNPLLKQTLAARSLRALVALPTYATALLFILLLHILSVTGMINLTRRKPGQFILLVAFLAGIFFSIPFAPPWDSDNGRAYAATIPVLAILPAFGLTALSQNNTRAKGENDQVWGNAVNTILSLLLILGCVAAMLLPFSRPARHSVLAQDCPEGRERLSILPGVDVYAKVNVGETMSGTRSVRAKDFTENLQHLGYFYPELKKELTSICPPCTIILTPKGYIFVKSDHFNEEARSQGICLRKITVSSVNLYVAD